MSKKKDELTKKQKEELQRLTDEISELAIEVIDDYESNLSEISGSVVEIHEDSPFLDEGFEGNKWKRVLRDIPIKSTEDNDTE
jgi:hypothetical protein